MTKTRTVKDSMGELEVPETACYGAQTQRAIDNFPVSGLVMPSAFLQALGRVKLACAEANHKIGGLDDERHQSISAICQKLIAGELDAEFPIDIFQTGSGTSTNMNANEVIAHLASQQSTAEVHPNDHVNMSQSSNDVIPTAIHVSASIACEERLLPALAHLENALENRAAELKDVVTTFNGCHAHYPRPGNRWLGSTDSKWSRTCSTGRTSNEKTGHRWYRSGYGHQCT